MPGQIHLERSYGNRAALDFVKIGPDPGILSRPCRTDPINRPAVRIDRLDDRFRFVSKAQPSFDDSRQFRVRAVRDIDVEDEVGRQ